MDFVIETLDVDNIGTCVVVGTCVTQVLEKVLCFYWNILRSPTSDKVIEYT